LEVTVPLSEEEQRLLEQLEQALAAEDPKFASTLRGSRTSAHYRRLAFGAGGVFLLGIVLLMTGVILPEPVVGVIGFVLMLGGAYLGLTSWRRSTQPEPLHVVGSERSSERPSERSADRRAGQRRTTKGAPRGPGRRAGGGASRGSSSFMERMEERWRRRRESGS